MSAPKKIRAPLMIVCILAAVISVGTAEEILKNVQPGATTVNLGDGYKMSFVLDESFEGYDLKVVDPESTVIGKYYEVVIYEAGNSDILIDIQMLVWGWEELYPKYMMPDKIDGSFGKIWRTTYQAEFEYLPGGFLTPDGKDIKYTQEVRGVMTDHDLGVAYKLPVFNTIVDSIHV